MSNRITFYSVSPVGNDVDMKVAANITISGGVATLSAAQTGNIGAGCRIEYNSTHAYIAPNRIGFDSGGTTEIKIGDKIEGGTSSATGIVRAVHISSGSWSGGDCAGHIYFEKTTGTWQDNEQINRVKPTSASNVGTTDGTLEGNIGNGNTKFVVLTATGADASDQSSTSVDHIYHEYSSLSTWEAGFTDSNHLGTTDLTINHDTNYVCCYYDHNNQTADGSVNVYVNGNLTGSDDILYIFSPTGNSESINCQRSTNGKWDSNKYYISDDGIVFYANEEYIVLNGLQFYQNDGSGHAINIDSGIISALKVECCIARMYPSTGTNYGFLSHAHSGTFTVVNSLVYEESGGGGNTWGIGCWDTDINFYCYNCTVSGCANVGIVPYRNNSATVTNCISFNNSDDFYGTLTATYCASDDTQTGTGNIDWDNGSADWNNIFTDYANYDFSLKNYTGTGAVIGQGTDLSSEGIWRDIAGNERGSSWDIGAFEYVAAGGDSLIKIINEALQFNEATLKLQSTQKVVNETLQLSESVEKKGTTKKVINETLQLNESTTKTSGMIKIISETLQIAESFAKISGITKVVNEALQLSESISRKIGITKIVNETLQLVEGIKKLSWTTKIINETLRFNEALFKRGTTKKVINETLQISETTGRLTGITKIINETLQIAESLAKITGITKVVNETLQLSESVLQKTGITKIINETLQISEKIKKLSWTTKVVNETLQLSETLFKKVSIKKIINETLQLSENIARKSGLIKIINEVLNIGENIIRTLAIALGWREVVKGDSKITTMITGDSPLD